MAVAQDLAKMWDTAEAWMMAVAGEKSSNGEPRFVDMPSFLTARFSTTASLAHYSLKLQDLDKQAVTITKMREPAKSEPYVRTVPGGQVAVTPADGSELAVVKHRTRLWQYGLEEQHSLKGASPLHAVLNCMKTNLIGKMNNTEKHPIEVLYNLVDVRQPGDPIADFTTGVANGNAVVVSCHLCCICCIELQWLEPPSSPAMQLEIAKRIIRCLRLTSVHNPRPDMQSQIQETLSSKIQASSRTRPTTMQMLYS